MKLYFCASYFGRFMSDVGQLFAVLNEKVEVLISALSKERDTVTQKEDKIAALNQQVSEQRVRIEQLEIENRELVANASHSEQLDVRIEHLVNEIDQCISLLKE